MTYTRVKRSVSPQGSVSPVKGRRSRSPARSRRSRSRSPSVDATNPGNNLYVTGLSTRVTSADVEKFFSKEGKVLECQLVTDPRSRESRGFAFVTMETVEDAERCIKYLNRSVLEGRLVTVEKAKRKRGRTPTPGRYQGLRDKRGLDRGGRDYGDRGGRDYGDRGGRDHGDRGDRDYGDRGGRDHGDRGGRDHGDRGDRDHGDRDRRRSRSYSPRRRQDREPPSRDRRGRSRSPPAKDRRVDEHSDSNKRRRDHS